MNSPAPNPAAPVPPARSAALDGLRGVACLQIVLFHYFLTVNLPFRWYTVVQRAMGAIDGVGVFFALSGFLIGGILLDHAKAANQLPVFYARRFFRIMPVYWLLLLSFLVVRWTDNHWRFGLIQFLDADIPFWHYLVFIQNYTTDLGALWLAATWSLAVEEQFYLMFPWLVRLMSRRLLVLGVVTSFVVCPLLRMQDPGSARLLLGSVDRLMAGVLVALVLRDDRWSSFLRRSRRWLGPGLAIFLVATVTLPAAFGVDTARFNLTVPAYVVLIYLVYTAPVGSWLARTLKLAAPIGLCSYFIYLFHLPVIFVCSLWLPFPWTGWTSLVAVAILAGLSYRFIEKPLINRGRKFNYQDEAPIG